MMFPTILSFVLLVAKLGEFVADADDQVSIAQLIDGLVYFDLKILHEDRHSYLWPKPLIPVRILYWPLDLDEYYYLGDNPSQRKNFPLIDSSQVRVPICQLTFVVNPSLNDSTAMQMLFHHCMGISMKQFFFKSHIWDKVVQRSLDSVVILVSNNSIKQLTVNDYWGYIYPSIFRLQLIVVDTGMKVCTFVLPIVAQKVLNLECFPLTKEYATHITYLARRIIDPLTHWCSREVSKNVDRNYRNDPVRQLNFLSKSVNPFDLKMNDPIEEVLVSIVFSKLVNQTTSMSHQCPSFMGQIFFFEPHDSS